tara:strand:+ start:20040 stop:21029 length:990 start_codon:yes stop_codon:yes gene_type:complete
MPITFTEGLEPSFPPGSFDSELEHVKLLYTEVEAGEGYVNVLADPVTNLITEIDSRTTGLNSAKSSINSDIALLQGTQVPVDPPTVPPTTNLPEGWELAGYTTGDIGSVISTLQGVISSIDSTTSNLSNLKTEINTVDIDNFKLHMDLLSGVDEAPPPGIFKPNNPGIMGMVRAVTDIENRFGESFTNYLELVFETLFIGDLTVANAQSHIETDPFNDVTYGSIGVASRVNANPFNETPAAIISDIGTWASPLGVWNTAAATHKPIFEQHVIDDMAEFHSLEDKLQRYVQAYNISAYIQDPYYAFMYTDVFGSGSVINIINQLQSGAIK